MSLSVNLVGLFFFAKPPHTPRVHQHGTSITEWHIITEPQYQGLHDTNNMS